MLNRLTALTVLYRMKRILFLLVPLVLLGAGCGDDYVTGASSDRVVKGGFIIPGTVGVSAIVAPDFNTLSGKPAAGDFSFVLPR